MNEQLAEMLKAIIVEARAQRRPLSPSTMLSPRQAAAEIGSLGIDAGVFWLRQRGLVTTIPAFEFGKHRPQTPLELVRWGDVLDEVSSRKAPERRAGGGRGLKSGGLHRGG